MLIKRKGRFYLKMLFVSQTSTDFRQANVHSILSYSSMNYSLSDPRETKENSKTKEKWLRFSPCAISQFKSGRLCAARQVKGTRHQRDKCCLGRGGRTRILSLDVIAANTADVTVASTAFGYCTSEGRLINSSRDDVSADLIRAPGAAAQGPL